MKSILRVKDLSVKKNGQTILEIEQEIDILPQEKVAILGENGAGKTTFVHAILSEIPFEGEIKKSFEKKECGIVFQENVYHELLKVYELVDIVLSDKKEKKARFYKDYELVELRKKYIKDLSGGEKQRLTLGLVLEEQKTLYIFDELTSGLDYKKRLSLLMMMKEKTANSVVLNATHYFEEIEGWATKILLLKQGKLLFFGSTASFFERFSHYCAIKIDNSEEEIHPDLKKYVKKIDTGDGKAFICFDKESQREVERTLSEKKVAYKIIRQNIYTTYLVACEGGEE